MAGAEAKYPRRVCELEEVRGDPHHRQQQCSHWSASRRPSMETRCWPVSSVCKRCGRKLTLRYSSVKHHIPRYSCSRAWRDNGGPHCIAFGGLRVDEAIEETLLGVVGPSATPAPTAAAKEPENGVFQPSVFLGRN
ncbi:zinc ribbon domain-containing protein [Bradyrhizobium sp. CW1]|uniref:zinc ribbon domain-containing protein n=1 Tax=Bradyrhizobium sp. CW1 TaxID=2782686 RepID=UPI003208BF26